MLNFVIKEKEAFKAFIRDSKLFMFIIGFFILLSYGIKMFYFSFSIDTEVLINDYYGQLRAWQSIDRIGMVFTKKLFFNGFNPYVANFLTYVNLWIVCMSLSYLVQKVIDRKRAMFATIIIPILFVTHPVSAEQLNFILQSFEVTFACILLVLSLLFTYYFVHTKFKAFVLLAILFSAWAFLTYQSLLLFFIAGTFAMLILLLYGDQKEDRVKKFGYYFYVAMSYLAVFILANIIAQVIIRVLRSLSGRQMSAYLLNQIQWGKFPVEEIVNRILEHISNVLFAMNIVYSYSFLISMTLVVIVLLYKVAVRKKFAWAEVFLFFLLSLSPFFLTIFIGSGEAIRAQMPTLQFVIAFQFFYVYLHLRFSILKKALLVFCFALAFHQSNVTANLFLSEHAKYEEDVSLAHRINYQLDTLGVGNRSNYALVILGKHDPESVMVKQVETIGHSFFAWDIGTKQGTTTRAIHFMRTLGYNFQRPTEEQLDYAWSLKSQMPLWPNKDSIRVEGNLIILKLSDD